MPLERGEKCVHPRPGMPRRCREMPLSRREMQWLSNEVIGDAWVFFGLATSSVGEPVFPNAEL